MINQILKELRIHAPFTVFGALTGIFVMVFFQQVPEGVAFDIFYILHPIHVVLSALVTASMYQRHTCGRITGKCLSGKCNLWVLLLVGYFGSVGIATISDSVIPYLGEVFLDLPKRQIHIGFIEKWWLINPLAFLGIAIAYLRPATKFPHSGHVLLSTWASLFHMFMAMSQPLSGFVYMGVFVFLFLAVWLPCCLSDIIFPLLFVKKKSR